MGMHVGWLSEEIADGGCDGGGEGKDGCRDLVIQGCVCVVVWRWWW